MPVLSPRAQRGPRVRICQRGPCLDVLSARGPHAFGQHACVRAKAHHPPGARLAPGSAIRGEWPFAGGELPQARAKAPSNSLSAAIAAARSGWGWVRALSCQTGPDMARGALVHVLARHGPEPLPVQLVYADGQRAPVSVRAFIALTRERLHDEPMLADEGNVGDCPAADQA